MLTAWMRILNFENLNQGWLKFKQLFLVANNEITSEMNVRIK